MDRWTGVVHVSLSSGGGPLFKVAASLLRSSSNSLAVPFANAILFNGDRVHGTGDAVIERLSDSRNLAGILAGKFAGVAGGGVNAWVVDAARFSGPFAVYKELIPILNSRGEPNRYDPSGFTASAAVVSILQKSIDQIQNVILRSTSKDEAHSDKIPPPAVPLSPPKTIILGFSKGGVVVNQLLVELAHWVSQSTRHSFGHSQSSLPHATRERIIPSSSEDLLSSISEFHYVDVGLNCTGAYITDAAVIKKIADYLKTNDKAVRVVLHGTPRQWSDSSRLWICKEKDKMVQLLQDEAQRCEGKLQVVEKLYFADRPRSLQMHFEILEAMDLS